MRRFFVEEIKKTPDCSCIIKGREARHILKVLRMGKGDRFILMDRAGDRYSAVIESVAGTEMHVKLTDKVAVPVLHTPVIILCQAVLKSGPMDYLIEKTSELGVTRIMPFASERTVTKIDSDGSSNKVRRWREIAISAAKQSDRVVPAEISTPASFHDILKQCQNADALKIILWEKENSKDLKELLRESARGPDFIGMIGPEGGFSPEEITAAVKAGFIPVSLGKRILRAETAALTLVAILQYEQGDLSLKGVTDSIYEI